MNVADAICTPHNVIHVLTGGCSRNRSTVGSVTIRCMSASIHAATAPAEPMRDLVARPMNAKPTASTAQPISTDIPSSAVGTASIITAAAQALYAGTSDAV